MTTTLHAEITGPTDGPSLVLAQTLGTDLAIWDAVISHLPRELRILRFDLPGHGKSSAGNPPYSMGGLVRLSEALCDTYRLRDSVFVGLGVGGMIAQGLAVKRPDMLRALVLSNTAAKLGQPKYWLEHGDMARDNGMAALAPAMMKRWFARSSLGRADMHVWQNKFTETNVEGYAGICAAIAGTDFYTPTGGLRIPTLGIAGSEDGLTPADLVRETVDLIPGSQFAVMRRVGHLPCIEDPQGFAQLLLQFLSNIGHLTVSR